MTVRCIKEMDNYFDLGKTYHTITGTNKRYHSHNKTTENYPYISVFYDKNKKYCIIFCDMADKFAMNYKLEKFDEHFIDIVKYRNDKISEILL